MRVLFTGKEHRQRRRETILHPPKGIQFVTQQSLDEMKLDYKFVEKKKITANFLRYNNYIPKKDLQGINLIYSPGKIITNNFPWVVEIDNVACLAYYNLSMLKIFKPIIKAYLKSKNCKKIICMSEAAQLSISYFFKDKNISEKTCVVYPYVKPMEKAKRKDKKIRMLYVSTHFYLKGGREILRAFEYMNMRFNNVELTIVSNTPKEIIEYYNEKFDNIYFVKANLTKKELYERYYTQSDVFLQVSFQDSFNLATLEAISCGLPVIATDMFALPEMVRNNFNGVLMDSPIDYFDKNCQPNKKYWKMDLDKHIEKSNFFQVEADLVNAMDLLIRNNHLREGFGKRSEFICNTVFAEKNRKQNLKRALCVE